MKKVITYGTYDLLHQGHINLLQRAKNLGDYLIVGVTTDNFDLERGKLNVCESVMQRIEAVRRTGLADEIIIEEYVGQKIDDIRRYGIDIFAIGSDWVGKFDYLKEFCQVVYLPRTEGISSTMLREERQPIRLGIVGTGNIAHRFVREASFVSSNTIVAAYNPDQEQCQAFCTELNIPNVASSFQELLSLCDAVYIASPHLTHFDYARQALEEGRHVLCETPLCFKEAEARELLSLAKQHDLVLMSALKTAYCPAFKHVMTMLKSGVIGEIVDVSASVTTLTDENSDKLNSMMAGGSMSENACFPMLPIFRLLGTEWKMLHFFSKMKNNTDIYTKAILEYDNAIATFQVGLGVKSEGNMVVSGTKGYIYVPAPWWKTDYFELRFEDQNKNRKFFYPYDGDGLRYEIKEFITDIINHTPDIHLLPEEIVAMARLQEHYILNKVK